MHSMPTDNHNKDWIQCTANARIMATIKHGKGESRVRNISPLKGPQMDVWASQPAWLLDWQQSVVATSSPVLLPGLSPPPCCCSSRSKCLQPTQKAACLSMDLPRRSIFSMILKSTASPYLWHIKRGPVCISWRATARAASRGGE